MTNAEQVTYPCVIMRSGTSKGIYLKDSDLPEDKELRDKVILAIFGSPDPRQIDGLGGADILTSKLAIVGESDRDDADVEYTFGQVVLDRPLIQYSGLCGNISAGVGPFAVDEGMVEAVEPVTDVRVFNTNTNQIFTISVPVENGKAKIVGDYAISGVNGTGAKLDINMAKTVGSVTGKLLPTGNASDVLDVLGKNVEVSMVDVVNPCVFIKAEDVGLTGTENPQSIKEHAKALDMIEEARRIAAGKMGFSTKKEDLDADPRPMAIIVSKAADYTNYLSGESIASDSHDVNARCFMISGKTREMHQAFPGSISVATGVASRIKGSVLNQVMKDAGQVGEVCIGHPLGSVVVDVAIEDGNELKTASYSRTARRIMDGEVYIPASIVG